MARLRNCRYFAVRISTAPNISRSKMLCTQAIEVHGLNPAWRILQSTAICANSTGDILISVCIYTAMRA
jgi:hypothetical protein